MSALTPLGIIHTAISLLAVGAGLVAFVRDREISAKNQIGKLYILTTVLTCVTGFGIFQHGGFGQPHALGIITLLVLAVAGAAKSSRYFGKAHRYVETVGYSLTFFFHMIPGIVETSTRLPVGAPLVADRESPILQAIIGGLFVVFLIGAALQVRSLRAKFPPQPATGKTAADSAAFNLES